MKRNEKRNKGKNEKRKEKKIKRFGFGCVNFSIGAIKIISKGRAKSMVDLV